MDYTVVRYKAKPGEGAKSARLIEMLFAELAAKQPDGVRYLALQLDDDTFIHFVSLEAGATPVSALDAFAGYHAGIQERCLEQPVAADATIIGNYRMLDGHVSSVLT